MMQMSATWNPASKPSVNCAPWCGMGGGAEDVDASGSVFDHRQNVGGGAVKQVDGEEVAGQDGLGLEAQEL